MIYYKARYVGSAVSNSGGIAVFQDLLSFLFSLITDVGIYSTRKKGGLVRVLHTHRKQERTL